MANELFDDLAAEVKEAEDQLADAPAEEGETETVTEETETEQQVESVEEEKEEKKETPRVPLPELQAERKKRQALEAEIKERDEKYTRLEERLNLINEKLQPQTPSYEEDPAEHLRQRGDQTAQSVEELNKRMEEFNQQSEMQRQQYELTQHVVASENEFRQTAPDYDDALAFLRGGRVQEYAAMGITDPAQQQQMLNQESIQLAASAVQAGLSPAELAYNIAVNRGYAKKAGEVQQKDPLDNIEKGQKKSASLSNVGGGEERVLDIEALANMDDDDFSQAMANGQWDKIMRNT